VVLVDPAHYLYSDPTILAYSVYRGLYGNFWGASFMVRSTVLRKVYMLDKIDKKYDVVYADPPWKMDFSISHNRDFENHYPTMTLEEICALQIPAADDSILYLWTTNLILNEGLIVLEKWGFRYVSNLIWDKVNFGCGWWSRVQHEILLIGVKGKMSPPEPEERCRSIISIKSDRSKNGHSRKPQN